MMKNESSQILLQTSNAGMHRNARLLIDFWFLIQTFSGTTGTFDIFLILYTETSQIPHYK